MPLAACPNMTLKATTLIMTPYDAGESLWSNGNHLGDTGEATAAKNSMRPVRMRRCLLILSVSEAESVLLPESGGAPFSGFDVLLGSGRRSVRLHTCMWSRNDADADRDQFYIWHLSSAPQLFFFFFPTQPRECQLKNLPNKEPRPGQAERQRRLDCRLVLIQLAGCDFGIGWRQVRFPPIFIIL